MRSPHPLQTFQPWRRLLPEVLRDPAALGDRPGVSVGRDHAVARAGALLSWRHAVRRVRVHDDHGALGHGEHVDLEGLAGDRMDLVADPLLFDLVVGVGVWAVEVADAAVVAPEVAACNTTTRSHQSSVRCCHVMHLCHQEGLGKEARHAHR